MKPIDFRNETLHDIEARLDHLRAAALDAWRRLGPGTTREVARLSGMDILTFRPRTTELVQLGLVCLDESGQVSGHEGVYRARTDREWLDWITTQRESATSRQGQLL